MTDKELLEYAAKAAEIDWIKDCVWIENGFYSPFSKQERISWNPLTDDGDALRLAVKIGMRDYLGLEVQTTCVQATCFEPWEHCKYEEYKNQDPYAATRRAIVRAAAEIGKEMK